MLPRGILNLARNVRPQESQFSIDKFGNTVNNKQRHATSE